MQHLEDRCNEGFSIKVTPSASLEENDHNVAVDNAV
jgi:hypothetical protein